MSPQRLPRALAFSAIFALACALLVFVEWLRIPAPVKLVEVGTVHWGRDFDLTRLRAKVSGKPMFVLFQETPGCKGCRKFGSEVLSDPEIVKAIEDNFTPLLISNSLPGRDAEIVKRYGEPSWNYQVVRFLNSDGVDLIPREDHVWTSSALAARMVSALEKSGRPVPETLKSRAASVTAPAKT